MSDTHKTVGVLGGMGPDATVDFMAKVIALTPAERDQDHVHLLVDQNPGVPNRQTAILDGGEDPRPALAAMAERLEKAGADFLVIPCNTAYVFADAIMSATTIPLISIVDVTIDAVSAARPDATSVGVLATDGCLRAAVYQKGLVTAGLEPVLPSDGELSTLMDLINRIKAGDQDTDIAAGICALAEALQSRGAQAIIAGCTEISLLLDDTSIDVPLISSTDVLAHRTVQLARGELPLPNRE